MIAGELTIGEFMLFITLLLQLVWPLEALGWIINLGQRAVASAGHLRLARRDRAAAGALRAGHLPEDPLRVGFEDVRFAYGTEAEVPAASTWPSSPARSSPSAARPAPARRRCSTCSRASTIRPADGCSSAASTRGRARRRLRQAVALVTQRPVLFSVLLRENLLSARPDAN